MLQKILSLFPFLEIVIRLLYWKSKIIHTLVQYLTDGKAQVVKKESGSKALAVGDFSLLLRKLEGMGVLPGDTIIVHSAYGQLKGFGLTPEQVVDEFIRYLGPEGNLIMPAIPVLEGQPNLLDRFNLKHYKTAPIYDVQKTKCWTGVLPQILINKTGSMRSRSPLNSMVVYGANAKDLVRNDLFSEDSLPCGEGSVLALSLKFNAKMLFLGVDEVHSMTMIHVVEDLFREEWSIDNWYWKRSFEILDENYHEILLLSERDPFWALFYAERRFSKDLFQAGLIDRDRVGSLSISVCNANNLIEYLRTKNSKGYPYLIPFWYRRK